MEFIFLSSPIASGFLTSASVPVALVTIDAVVHVAVHPLVVRIGIGLGMAIRALEDRVVARIRVAG